MPKIDAVMQNGFLAEAILYGLAHIWGKTATYKDMTPAMLKPPVCIAYFGLSTLLVHTNNYNVNDTQGAQCAGSQRGGHPQRPCDHGPKQQYGASNAQVNSGESITLCLLNNVLVLPLHPTKQN